MLIDELCEVLEAESVQLLLALFNSFEVNLFDGVGSKALIWQKWMTEHLSEK